MNIEFIPCILKEKVNEQNILKVLSTLPNKIAILYSIQYEKIAKEIKSLLEKAHKITKFSQVLGCTKIAFSKETQAVLLVGSGMFHALSIAENQHIPIYIYEKESLRELSKKEVQSFEIRKRAAKIKFLSSNKIGVLISTKPGQQNLSRALKLKEKFRKKTLYFFLGDVISPAEFENFGLSSWINTACPRLDMDSFSIINIGDLN